MRNLILLFLLSMVSYGNAQKVAAIVNSPAGIAGSKIFAAASFGADLATGQWTGDLVLASPNLACSAIVNGSDIAGKFCVIDRGTCNFDVKCLAAQDVGAIAVIVMNHNDQSNRGGPPFVMGAVSLGGQITIPCIMLGYEDGVAIKAAMSQGIVNMTIGSFPKAANDLTFAKSYCDGTFSQPIVSHPLFGAYPSSQIKAVDDLNFVAGGAVTNVGTANQQNCKITCKVTNGTNEYYNETSDQFNVESDSTNGAFITKAFDYNGLAAGTYNVNYSVASDKPDDFISDNVYTSTFNVNNSILSKSRFNFASRSPNVSGAYVFGGVGTYQEQMMPFRLKHGKGLQIDTLYSYIQAGSGGVLGGLSVEGRLYRWEDANQDDNIDSDELILVAIGVVDFPTSDTRTSAFFKVVLENNDPNVNGSIYQVNNDNDFYIASIQNPGTSSGVVTFFGYDNDYNQELYVRAKDDAGTLLWEDYPNLTTRTQSASGGPDMGSTGILSIDCSGTSTTIFSPACIGLNIVKSAVGTKDISNEAGNNLQLTPNPAKDILIANLKLNTKSDVDYQIFDMSGKLVFFANEKNQGDHFNSSFNVSSLSNGQYILQANTSKGFLKKSFVVVK